MTEEERFRRCLAEVLRHEGGYVDHPADPGGATNLGVTLATAREHALDKDRDGDVDKADVKALTVDDAARVYRDGYWEPAHCGALPVGVDLMIFDAAVNCGVRRAKRWLQEALGVQVDGVIGPATRRALVSADPRALLGRLQDIRKRYYRGLNTFGVFGNGWLRRLTAVYAKSLLWAAG